MFVNKILSQYIHVISCFEGFIARNMMVRLGSNLNTWFSRYDFLTSKSIIYVLMSSILDFSACSQPGVGVCGPYHYAIGPAGARVLHVP